MAETHDPVGQQQLGNVQSEAIQDRAAEKWVVLERLGHAKQLQQS
jgi:hypothetical protein